MKNKIKLSLILMLVLGFSFFANKQALATSCKCGPSHGQYYATAAEITNPCNTGISSNISGNAPPFSWSCSGDCESINCSSSSSSSSSSTGVEFPTDTGLPVNNDLVKGILTNLANWLLSIIGIVAIISFVISGFQYFMTGVDEKAAEKAKKAMTASIIGVIVALSGYVIIFAINNLLSGKNNF